MLPAFSVKAGDLVSPELAERRNIILVNPPENKQVSHVQNTGARVSHDDKSGCKRERERNG